ncbi:GntR family transcriptional regulator, partial [Mesorhizobium sp. M0317]|uniref:GntR family transcriptional regulator n=1 Tax=Mesorhizobium sp. M0317 TaxID=2956935 RepID=UPI00333CB11D
DAISTIYPAGGDGDILRDKVYTNVRNALMAGRFVPGQKMVIRQLAEQNGTSLTPVRECLRRLVAEGVLEGEANRSVRVPRMTGAKMRELRDIRLAVEGLATARSAERITPEEVSGLRRMAEELADARRRGNVDADVAKLSEFQLGVYRASGMPQLAKIIESLWLQTGPYLKLLFPDYVKSVAARGGDWRGRLCAALEAHDAEAARREIVEDVGQSLDYLTTLADAADAFRA